jgi:D-alanine-D-alanine ligase
MITVGLTYDLKDDYLKKGFSPEEVAEFDALETIDALENTLRSLHFEVIRIGNIFDLIAFLNSGKRVDIAFNICEGMYGIAREAQVPCLLDAFRIPYVFSEPDILNLTLDKSLTKLVLKESGIRTAPFKVIHHLEDIEQISLEFPLFIKPVAEGTSKGIDGYSIIDNKIQLKKSTAYLLEKFSQPVLVETFLPGREFTVGILGSGDDCEALGAMEILLNEHTPHPIYSYTVKKEWEKYASYKIAEDPVAQECVETAEKVWKLINGKDAGRIDFRVDAQGNPNFIEVNPLAGLNPTYSDLPILAGLMGMEYDQLIDSIMKSALSRTGMIKRVK